MKELRVRLTPDVRKMLSAASGSQAEVRPGELIRMATLHWMDLDRKNPPADGGARSWNPERRRPKLP